jgi:hypothetical protein
VRRVDGTDLLTERPRPTTRTIRGVVVTPLGLVSVFSFLAPASSHTWYSFIWRGRHYRRAEPVGRSRRSLAIMGGRFARAVAARRVR